MEHNPGWKDRFLAQLAKTPNVSKAARAAGISRSEAYKRKNRDPEFAQAWDDLEEESLDDLEEHMRANRAMDSDKVAMWLLEKKRYSKQRGDDDDEKNEVGWAGDEPARADWDDVEPEG